MALHASSGLTTPCGPQGNGAAGPRQVRSLPRRSVQAGQAGAWRKGKRRRSLLGHSCAACALAVRRVTEHPGTQTPGVDNERGETPEQHATAIDRMGPGRGDRPRPLQRLAIPQTKGTPRPRARPTLEDRARHARQRPARPPSAEPSAAPHASGLSAPPRRRGDRAMLPPLPPTLGGHRELGRGEGRVCRSHRLSVARTTPPQAHATPVHRASKGLGGSRHPLAAHGRRAPRRQQGARHQAESARRPRRRRARGARAPPGAPAHLRAMG